MIEQDQKWKIHMDSKTTAFATCMEQEKIQFKATTNQTIKAYMAMNDRLRFENETIKACCDSQAIQQAIMQQQITELLARQSICPSNYTQDHPMSKQLHPRSPNGLQPQAQRTSNSNDNV
jgi:hypothetical protein